MITTERDLIRGVAKRWRNQYEPMSRWDTRSVCGRHPRIIAEELDQLDGETATRAQVESIIGNDSWTRLQCDRCGSYVPAIITLYTLRQAETSTFSICATCLSQAALQLPNMPA